MIALIILAGSCSGGDLTSLSFEISPVTGGRSANAVSHQCLGLYDIVVSADRTVWEVYPHRAGMAHLNIIPLLEGPTDFLTIPEDGIVFEPDYIAATIKIEHPLKSGGDFDANYFTGFDVKGIIMFPGTYQFPTAAVITQDLSKGEGRVLNADGYSRWWNPTEFSEGDFLRAYVEGKLAIPKGGSNQINATLNPYKLFYPPTQVARHSFPSTKSVSVTYNILLPETGLPFALMYAIDAAYEEPVNLVEDEPIVLTNFEMTANQPEPFDLAVSVLDNTLWADGIYQAGGSFNIEVEISDWQDPRPAEWFPFKDRGVRKVCFESPGLFDGQVNLSMYEGDDYPISVANGKTTTPVVAGEITTGQIEINGVVVPFAATPVTNTSKQNADYIIKAINQVSATHIKAKIIDIGGEQAKISLKHLWAGMYSIKILDDPPNIQPFGLDTIDTALQIQEGNNWYYITQNGTYKTKWTKAGITNDLTVVPGTYPILVTAVDYSTDPIFPGETNHPSAYTIVYVDIIKTKPNVCLGNAAVHNVEMGTGTIANAKLEYRADCDFIGYPNSPYVNRLLFNKGTELPDGIQEIGVMIVDTPDVASALSIITITDTKKGIPLILQEDDVTGNIIVVNHIDQDNMLVFDYQGNLLNSFDYGDGDNGFNSPIAVDFDEQGDMWVISHRGVAGPELRHWYNAGGGNYINMEIDRIDLAPIFGTGYTIYDLKLLPSENFLIIFASDQQGHIEFFDTTQVPPAQMTDRTIVNLYDTPLAPSGYPGYRIAVGGDLLVDRAAGNEQARCRIVAAANFVTGPLVFAKFDFYANQLNKAAFTMPGLCMALNNNPNEYLRRIVAFPLAQSNQFRVFDVPATGW